jgi:Na+/proline symporter
MTNDMDTNEENNSKHLSCFSLVWPIMWLAYGLAMIIWPDAYYYPSEYACADPDELIDCFLATSWGTPAAIAISLTIGLLTGLSAIRKRRNK